MSGADDRALERGRRVWLRAPRPEDLDEMVELARTSRRLHRPWVHAPADAVQFEAYLGRCERDNCEGLFVCTNDDGRIAGVFNLSEIVRGGFQSSYMGYYANARFAGMGYMREGLALVLRHAFTAMGLHRVEANIQPGNAASIALVRGAGFTLEGYSRRYLKIGGRWRDHERWAILAEDWRKK